MIKNVMLKETVDGEYTPAADLAEIALCLYSFGAGKRDRPSLWSVLLVPPLHFFGGS